MSRWPSLFIVLCLLVAGTTAQAASPSGKVIKVLPHFLDLKGRHTLAPSLYERDAYQAQLRLHPERCSGLRMDTQWKAKHAAQAQLKIRVELRGGKKGSPPTQAVFETPVKQKGIFSHWTALTLSGEEFQKFGELVAWRVTLWDGGQLLGEQKSFLW